jgi:F-type H+-transporting ATPase subunit gamma
MSKIQEVSARIVSLNELLDIVAAIRAIAASQMQQGQRSLEAINRYSQGISDALAETAALLDTAEARPEPPRCSRLGVVAICSEHGFCGAFNERILDVVDRVLAESDYEAQLLVIGSRGAQRAVERGRRPKLTLQMATHSGGVTAVARRAAAELYRMFSQGEVGRLEVIHAAFRAGQQTGVDRRALLPLDPSVLEPRILTIPPLTNLRAGELFEELAGEYFFAALENALTESFTSENAARFRTMEAAHQNIEKKFDELNLLARRLRQEAVTTEILDLISGAEAMKSA